MTHAQLDLKNNPLLDPSSASSIAIPVLHASSSSFESGSSSAQMEMEMDNVVTPTTPQLVKESGSGSGSMRTRRMLQPSPPIIELSRHDHDDGEGRETISLESDEEGEEEDCNEATTGKKSELGGNGRKNVRTWAGRESPSASPRLSKKYKAEMEKVPFPGVGGGSRSKATEEEDAGMWEGDRTMTQEEYELMMELAVARGRATGRSGGSASVAGVDGIANADAHAVGFSIWSDGEGKAENSGSASVRGYFDDMDSSYMGDGGSEEHLAMARIRTRSTPASTSASTPKYTAENIRNVGRAKVVSTGAVGSSAGMEDKGNEQENVPPLGWVDLADYEEDKEKSRAAIKGKADIGAGPRGEIKDGLVTPSRKRRTSGASLADPPSTGGSSLADRGRIGSSASLTTPSTSGGGRSGGSGRAVGIRAVPSPSPSKGAEEARRLRNGRDL